MKLLISTLLIAVTFIGCSVLSGGKTEYTIDPVCGMKVDKDEAYTWHYNNTTYYFDNYTCKETFKMNPEKFLNNICTPQNDSIPMTEHTK